MDEVFESERPINSQENTTMPNNSSNEGDDEGDDANTNDEENTRRIIGELQSAIQPIHPPRPGVFFSSDDDAATALKPLQGCHFSTDDTARSTADASTRGEDRGNATESNEAPSFDSCQGNTDGSNQQISNHSQNSTRTVLDAEQNEENAEAVVHQSRGSERGIGEVIERISALRRTMARAHHENVSLAQCQELILLRRSLDLVLERNDSNGEVAQRQSRAEDIMEEQDAPSASEVQRPSKLRRAQSFVRRFQRNGSMLAEYEQNNENSITRFINFVGSSYLLETTLAEATLVEDVEVGGLAEVFEAEPVSFMERKWKMFASAAGALVLMLLTISVAVFYDSQNGKEAEVVVKETPTLSPTFDPRPRLEKVQERGHVLCGMSAETIESGEGLYLDLCRSIAAVVVGDPDGFVGVPVIFTNRWQHLLDGSVDLVVLGDTYTIEREIREKSTGSGFTFSTPYNYDGMAYVGNQTLVRCAEEYRRYGECSSLKICAEGSTTHHDFLQKAFPSVYFTIGSSLEELTEMLFNNTCNVVASEKTFVRSNAPLYDAIRDGKYVWGEKLISKEPYAIITHNEDREFSDIVNWVVQALLLGEERGLSKDMARCQNYTGATLTLHGVSDLKFMNAVHCVGNYAEIIDGDSSNRGMNQINRGTGMLYSIPFGNLDSDDTGVGQAADNTLTKIRRKGSLACGVVVPDDFEGDITTSDKLVGMSVDYCRTLSATIFRGDSDRVIFLAFSETNNGSVVALTNGTLDVLVGGRKQQNFDFETSPELGGLYFSTPYYYGNESASDVVSIYSIATNEDDVMFTSYVNIVVMATIFAQENDIQKHKSRDMPLISIFGSDRNWVLIDAISYSGSYGELYAKHFGREVVEETKDRNTLNEGGPLMLSFLSLYGGDNV